MSVIPRKPKGRNAPPKTRPTDAALILELLSENRFPSIWMPSAELCDLHALRLHRDQWVRLRAREERAAATSASAWRSPRRRVVDARWPGNACLINARPTRGPSPVGATGAP